MKPCLVERPLLCPYIMLNLGNLTIQAALRYSYFRTLIISKR